MKIRFWSVPFVDFRLCSSTSYLARLGVEAIDIGGVNVAAALGSKSCYGGALEATSARTYVMLDIVEGNGSIVRD